MKFTLTLDLERADQLRICQNSIERVINSSVFLIETDDDNAHTRELTDINLQDWEDLKPLTVLLWNAVRDSIFIAADATRRSSHETRS